MDPERFHFLRVAEPLMTLNHPIGWNQICSLFEVQTVWRAD